MKRLLYILGIVVLFSAMTSCNNDDNGGGGSINPVNDVQVTPYYGSVILNWSVPTDEDYYYTLVSYVNAEGKKVSKKISCYDTKSTGKTEAIIGGFTDENTYTFTLTSYNLAGAASESVTVTGTPKSTEAAKDYVVTTVKAVPAVQGSEVSWTNETGVECYVIVSFQDSKGVKKEKKFNATTSGKGIIASFVKATTLTVTVENAAGKKSASRTFDVTPTLGEISKTGMKISSVSSDWGGYLASYLIDNDIYTYWHTQLTGFPHYVVVDLGNEYNVNKIQLVRRQDDGGNGQWAPNRVQFLYSLDGKDFTNIGEFDFDVQQIYGHEYSFAPVYARYIKMIGLSGGQPWMHMAEIYFYMNAN